MMRILTWRLPSPKKPRLMSSITSYFSSLTGRPSVSPARPSASSRLLPSNSLPGSMSHPDGFRSPISAPPRGGVGSGLALDGGALDFQRSGLSIDQNLLGDPQEVVHEPVQHEAARQIDEGCREDQGHEEHHSLLRPLLGVCHVRHGELLLGEHGNSHEDRRHRDAKARDVEAIRPRKIPYPEQERSLTQLDGDGEDP